MKDFNFLSDICESRCNVVSPSTFGSGGNLERVLYPKTQQELALAVSAMSANGVDYIILGACSNTLIGDNGASIAVLSTQKLKGKETQGERLYVFAGESLSSVCRFACENSLSGIEALCSIPGSIGGGLAMNCGAFGREIGDVVEYVDMLIDGKIERLYAKDLSFSYRYSKVRQLGIVIGACIKLKSSDKFSIAKDIKGYVIARSKSQPKGKSLGSVFKKAGDISAGYYIDKAGLKGCKIGGAQISEMHANFIINTGGARSIDFIKLADYARQEVDKRFGIKLEYEVEFVPRTLLEMR